MRRYDRIDLFYNKKQTAGSPAVFYANEYNKRLTNIKNSAIISVSTKCCISHIERGNIKWQKKECLQSKQ